MKKKQKKQQQQPPPPRISSPETCSEVRTPTAARWELLSSPFEASLSTVLWNDFLKSAIRISATYAEDKTVAVFQKKKKKIRTQFDSRLFVFKQVIKQHWQKNLTLFFY